MNAYVMYGALICEDCAVATAKDVLGGTIEDMLDGERAEGPIPFGGGESDYPQHCCNHDTCIAYDTLPDGRKIGKFLENPLTSDGYRNLKQTIKDDLSRNRHNSVAVSLWGPFYGVSLLWEAESEGESPPDC